MQHFRAGCADFEIEIISEFGIAKFGNYIYFALEI